MIEVNRQAVIIAGYGLVICWLAFVMVRAHRKNPMLQITDILTGDNGRYASMKLFEASAFVTHTFGTVFLIVTTAEGLAALNLFATVWVLRASVKQALVGTLPQPPPGPSTTTTTAPAGATVTTQVSG